jgi:hypothetical protein
MANNEKAFMWACKDFSDNLEGELEKLALKF